MRLFAKFLSVFALIVSGSVVAVIVYVETTDPMPGGIIWAVIPFILFVLQTFMTAFAFTRMR